MKALLPGTTLIGFTGTPLLKKDKQKSIEVFGPYIHTYKYDEAVRDGVVLDLRYEARDGDQNITPTQSLRFPSHGLKVPTALSYKPSKVQVSRQRPGKEPNPPGM